MEPHGSKTFRKNIEWYGWDRGENKDQTLKVQKKKKGFEARHGVVGS